MINSYQTPPLIKYRKKVPGYFFNFSLIVYNAKSALEKIGKESKINKLRIEYPTGGFELKL